MVGVALFCQFTVTMADALAWRDTNQHESNRFTGINIVKSETPTPTPTPMPTVTPGTPIATPIATPTATVTPGTPIPTVTPLTSTPSPTPTYRIPTPVPTTTPDDRIPWGVPNIPDDSKDEPIPWGIPGIHSPKTGDDSNIWLWACLLIASMFGLRYMLLCRKQKLLKTKGYTDFDELHEVDKWKGRPL